METRTLGRTGVKVSRLGLGARYRRGEKDLLGGQDVVLDHTLLDWIDEIVPPGSTLNRADAGNTPSSLEDPRAGRRPR